MPRIDSVVQGRAEVSGLVAMGVVMKAGCRWIGRSSGISYADVGALQIARMSTGGWVTDTKFRGFSAVVSGWGTRRLRVEEVTLFNLRCKLNRYHVYPNISTDNATRDPVVSYQ